MLSLLVYDIHYQPNLFFTSREEGSLVDRTGWGENRPCSKGKILPLLIIVIHVCQL